MTRQGTRLVNRPLWNAAACAAVALVCVARPAAAERIAEPTELVDRQHCMFCHTPDRAFLAPAFHDIAGRYRDVPGARAMLVDKLRHGGTAHWGDQEMPLAPERGGPLSDEDAQRLVDWVMSQ
ncbi:c-type cytochrome [Burkholderia pseudomultivorans]|uniref:c-type cytochrome n=1 Tax=Burkholderia pseudomultivorans TaxID=1207504 RepID=UPI0012D8A9B2